MFLEYIRLSFSESSQKHNVIFMRKGIRTSLGFLILLWGLSQFFSDSFQALDSAAAQSFKTIEAAAITSKIQLQNL
jgi:hypothetical protein